VILVDSRVPHRVQVVCSVVVREGEFVTSSVASGEVSIDPVGRVEGLMDITDIVDQKSHSVGPAKCFFIFRVSHNSLISVGVLVVTVVAEPVDKFRDDEGDVLGVELEVGVVIDGCTVINERSINKVPLFLPLATLHSDVISQGSTFDERIVTFFNSQG